MERIPPGRNTEVIEHVLETLPPGIRRRLGSVPFLIDTDPVAVGVQSLPSAPDGRSLRDTSHAIWVCHQGHLSAARREATVVLLGGDERDQRIILHELGHILDERLDFDRPGIVPLDDYAGTNSYEAFATAFQSWATPRGPDDWYYHTREQLMAADPAACAFFDRLAG